MGGTQYACSAFNREEFKKTKPFKVSNMAPPRYNRDATALDVKKAAPIALHKPAFHRTVAASLVKILEFPYAIKGESNKVYYSHILAVLIQNPL